MLNEKQRQRFQQNIVYIGMAAFPLAVFIIFFIVPNVQTIIYSFFEWDGISPKKAFVGFQNYMNLVSREPMFLKAFKNTIVYTMILVILGTIMGLFLAVLLEKGSKLNSFFRALFFAPGVLCPIAVGLMWKIGVYDPNIGVVNNVLRSLGLKAWTCTWLSEATTVIPSIVFIHVWTFMGFSMIMYISGLHSIDDALYEAAAIDGARKRQAFFLVTLPLLRDTTGTVVLLALINGFTSFDYVYFIMGSGSSGKGEVLSTLLYRQMFGYRSVGRSASTAVFLLIFVLVFSLIQRRIQRSSQ